jgi:hypothetical protein
LSFGLNTGVHATHFENSFKIGSYRLEDSDDDGAVTLSFPLEARYGISQAIALGIYLEPGIYLDSNATQSNGYFLAGVSGRYYLVNKDHFAWDAGLDLGMSVLRIKEDNANFTDTYSGGSFRLCSNVYFYFGRTFGVSLGLKYAAHNMKWRDRDPKDNVLDAVDYEATLRTSGVHLQISTQVRF